MIWNAPEPVGASETVPFSVRERLMPFVLTTETTKFEYVTVRPAVVELSSASAMVTAPVTELVRSPATMLEHENVAL